METKRTAAELETELRSKIDAGMKDLRKQCKQLSKNELINALLQQLEQFAHLQAACQQLIKENNELKGRTNAPN